MDWISVKDETPASGKKVLATYKNDHGKRRTVCAWYFERWAEDAESCDDTEGVAEYNEAEDAYFYLPGWYETIENWDDYGFVSIYEGEITHWMPLPKSPEAEEGGKK